MFIFKFSNFLFIFGLYEFEIKLRFKLFEIFVEIELTELHFFFNFLSIKFCGILFSKLLSIEFLYICSFIG